jgi:hypothetical protein
MMGGVHNYKESFGKVTRKGVVPISDAVRNEECLSERSAKEYIYDGSVWKEEEGRDQSYCTRDGTVCENADCVVWKGAKLNLTYNEA